MFTETGHKILQRARSLRRVRPEEPSPHARQISISSDVSRASSSGSDVSGGRRDHSVEWDPLRLHPSMEVDCEPHITPLYHPPRHHYHNHHDTESRHAAHLHFDHHHPGRHSHDSNSDDTPLRVYGGFDFGFSKTQTTTTMSAPAPDSGRRMLRTPKSEADLHGRHHTNEAGGHDATSAATVPPAPRRRPHPPGFEETDYFLKRGGWKRRGIIFVSD